MTDDSTATSRRLRGRLAGAFSDPEVPRLSRGLALAVSLVVDDEPVRVRLSEARLGWSIEEGDADVTVRAAARAWDDLLSHPPPTKFRSYTTLCLANPAFAVEGSPLVVAQSRAVLERVFEVVVRGASANVTAVDRSMDGVAGRYATVGSDGRVYEVFAEAAGEPVFLFLHTAGADPRQWHGQLSDPGLAACCRMTAFDLPFHGRSMPPRGWDGAPYRLDLTTYPAWCAAFVEQVAGAPVVVVGCSMGAAIALVLAADRPDLVAGVVSVEPPFRSKGRVNPYQDHAAVHGAHHNAPYVRGLMSPLSPEDDRRRAAWIYSQGAPGVYPGDLSFYSDEFDAAAVVPRIDVARTPLSLLSGSYDYSATPDDGARIADLIPRAKHVVMPELGHFPMAGNPDAFRPYLVDALRHASGGRIDAR